MTFSSIEVYQAYSTQTRAGRQPPGMLPHLRGAVPSTISGEEIEEQLARMLTSDLFTRSERMSRFLGFIVNETLEGRGRELNQYAIALEAFDKPDSFDPTTDPIIRVEAGRLRAKLREYYATSGLMDLVQIGMARIGYRPTFSRKEAGPFGSFPTSLI
jgi:hypothetical protein